jgi:uncharacterized repeat protein (TIGR01451 family)
MMTVPAPRNRLSILVVGLLIAGLGLMGLSQDASATLKPKLVITKKSVNVVQNGQQIVYTITVRNNGAGVSKDTVITDLLPDGLTVNSADSPCQVSGQLVECNVGNLAGGHSRSYKIFATPLLSNFDTPNDQVAVSRVEEQVSMPAGSIRTGTITCGPDGIMSDGSFRVDAVDQGTGNLASVKVRRLQSSSPSSFAYTLRNAATGQAQVKIFGVCLAKKTTEGNTLSVGNPLTKSITPLVPGFFTVVSQPCPGGTTPIAPGYSAANDVTLISSEPNASNGRTFTFKVDGPGLIQTSIRCLSNSAGAVNLLFTSVKKTVQIAPRATVTERLTCPDGYKGIVAGWKYNRKLVPLGNDPQPINRDFRIWNPTAQTRSATLHLLCLRIRTGQASPLPVSVTNTAVVSSSNQQDVGAILSASKTVTVIP